LQSFSFASLSADKPRPQLCQIFACTRHLVVQLCGNLNELSLLLKSFLSTFQPHTFGCAPDFRDRTAIACGERGMQPSLDPAVTSNFHHVPFVMQAIPASSSEPFFFRSPDLRRRPRYSHPQEDLDICNSCPRETGDLQAKLCQRFSSVPHPP
jgi:hypothetical protein